jgi:Domain of unknown function (DUF4276)
VSIRLYVEGGGDSKALRGACPKGFRMFLERAGIAGRLPRIVACGGRQDAYERFSTTHGGGEGKPLLLVDAEEPVTVGGSWEHLAARDGWERPAGAEDAQCHLMVQVMESWFLADKAALASFYGQGFVEGALPANPHVEQVPKADLLSGLAQATRNTAKGRYDKGSHSFSILSALDPVAVQRAAPHAERLLATLRATHPV